LALIKKKHLMRSRFSSLLLALLSTTLLAARGLAAPPSPPLWGNLVPGPYRVGFRSIWQLDYSRRYNTVFDDKTTYAAGKAPRPILINTWYPAETSDEFKPMPHRDYLAIQTEDPRLSRFASKLIAFEQGIVCKELTGRSIAELTDRQRQLLEQFWDTPTASRRNAPSVDARFPLVVYHAGFGSSYQDNAVLCEYLASHGYVVVGSTYMDPNGESFHVDGYQNSARDIEFLIAHARRHSIVDWLHIGLVGHSGGAQASLVCRAQDGSPIDAVVSLDTTQDYHSLSTPGWEEMTKTLLEKSKNLDGPLLIATNAYAIFQLVDSLKDADRYYLTFRELDHNDFIDQGIQRRVLECAVNPDKADLRSGLESARGSYEALCAYIRDFFDVYLKNPSAESKKSLLKKYGQNKLGGRAPRVDHVPPGVTGPEPYREGSDTPPTPRQFRALLAARGVEATVALLKQFHEKDPTAPILGRDFGDSLVEELLDKGRVQAAIAFYRLYGSYDPKLLGIFTRRGDNSRRFGATRGARQYYKKALMLDPMDAVAAERLKSLEEPKKD
jgi:pimeloyl-ACP methyl ester carboxylesterase